MKILYLKEEEVGQLVTIPQVIDALAVTFRDQAAGNAFTNPRNRLRMSGSMLHIMAGAIPGYFGYKAYATSAGKAQFFFYLFDAKSCHLTAMMEANTIGQIRTGAATGLATRVLSNPDAGQAALFGAGWQAETQLLAMDAVRELKCVFVVNRNADRRREFMKKMQPHVRAELVAPASAEDAVRSSQIITTITNSREPVFRGEWLTLGTHVNAAGGNMLLRREVDDQTLMRANRVVVDSIEQSKIEAGEFLGVIESGMRHWEDFVELRDVVAGSKPGRANSADITFFKSLGLAIEDVTIGKLLYERAIESGIGQGLEL